MLAIFWLSIIKAPRLYDAGNWFWDNIDKPGHSIAYASLAGTLLWAYSRFLEGLKLSMFSMVGLSSFAFLYSLLLEIVQYYLPHRTFDLWDLLANAIGIGLVTILFLRFNKDL